MSRQELSPQTIGEFQHRLTTLIIKINPEITVGDFAKIHNALKRCRK